MRKDKETKAFELGGEAKVISGSLGIVEHVVTVFGVLDAMSDIAHPGSWTKTIKERGGKFLVLDMHKADSVNRVLGKPVRVWEVNRDGLPQEIREKYPEATGGVLAHTKFLLNTPEGRGAFERIKEGALHEWSYRFDPVVFDYGLVKTRDGREVNARHLRAVAVCEYGPVLWGAVPDTMVTGVKAAAKKLSSINVLGWARWLVSLAELAAEIEHLQGGLVLDGLKTQAAVLDLEVELAALEYELSS